MWHVALYRHTIQTYRNEALREKDEGGKEDSVMSHKRYREDKCLGHIKDHTSPLVITFHDPYESS